MNCITLAMERPNIPPDSTERLFLSTSNYIFTVVFTVEMFIKVKCANFLTQNFSLDCRLWLVECVTDQTHILHPVGI